MAVVHDEDVGHAGDDTCRLQNRGLSWPSIATIRDRECDRARSAVGAQMLEDTSLNLCLGQGAASHSAAPLPDAVMLSAGGFGLFLEPFCLPRFGFSVCTGAQLASRFSSSATRARSRSRSSFSSSTSLLRPMIS